MPCTTLLVGKKASFDGSTMIARNEDAPSGQFIPKKFTVVLPSQQPRVYHSVLSHFTVELPEKPLRYTCMPNALPHRGIWGAAGVNAENVSMTATETIASNSRVLSGDPLVVYQPAHDGLPETPGGIGEEDMVTLVLPYIHSAREGVLRLGHLLESLGTYEMNGIAFQDAGEIWWMETIGGHHWIARKIPDDCYAVVPNQLSMDTFDFSDAFGEQWEHMCSQDLIEFIRVHHLNPAMDPAHPVIQPRRVFGTQSEKDQRYNTPRAWAVQRYLNPHAGPWDGTDPDYQPTSLTLPFLRKPEWRISVEDIKRVLSDHFELTPYDPYARRPEGDRPPYRPIGINRNNFLSVTQIRPDLPEEIRSIEWIAMGCNIFNALVPLYTNISSTPHYFSCTAEKVDTDSFYWANRILAVMGDAHYHVTRADFLHYQNQLPALCRAVLLRHDRGYLRLVPENPQSFCEQANREIAVVVQKETDALLQKVMQTASENMLCAFSMNDL